MENRHFVCVGFNSGIQGRDNLLMTVQLTFKGLGKTVCVGVYTYAYACTKSQACKF